MDTRGAKLNVGINNTTDPVTCNVSGGERFHFSGHVITPSFALLLAVLPHVSLRRQRQHVESLPVVFYPERWPRRDPAVLHRLHCRIPSHARAVRAARLVSVKSARVTTPPWPPPSPPTSALLRSTWFGCTNGAQVNPFPEDWAADYGEPVDPFCQETAPGSGVYERAWTNAKATWDCNARHGQIVPT